MEVDERGRWCRHGLVLRVPPQVSEAVRGRGDGGDVPRSLCWCGEALGLEWVARGSGHVPGQSGAYGQEGKREGGWSSQRVRAAASLCPPLGVVDRVLSGRCRTTCSDGGVLDDAGVF